MAFHCMWNKTPPPNQDPATCTCTIRMHNTGNRFVCFVYLEKAKAGTVVSILASGNPSISLR